LDLISLKKKQEKGESEEVKGRKNVNSDACRNIPYKRLRFIKVAGPQDSHTCIMLILLNSKGDQMNANFNLDQAIESLISVQCGPQATARQLYLQREILRSLARQAVAEHAMNRKKDLKKTISVVDACEHA
jgi:hypothetical protein